MCFFDSLRISDLVLEPKRAKATYVLRLPSGKTLEKDLIFSYGEKVFEDNAESWNMASVMVAQVALNYGLFCREIVFDGLFDSVDRRFILDMMENTSREIYVNKFLMPNEFITEAYRNMRPEKRKSYTNAAVRFENSKRGNLSLSWSHQDVDRNKCLVLSSGGKESLLSYGLLREIGKQVIPVYTNESGRHWFTALNAYRYMSDTDSNCKRVWCNADRIYIWMLRQMPCIREDFASVRADIYPVRLWTVGVFLFGSIPLARKNGAGNIVIGDEYDTSIRDRYEGIRHYHGLFDQSRYFDLSLTRYYIKKGWNMHQFSILRSLSELLVLKILSARYPELQARQISCHAASTRDGRAYPCGKCEKCRRIVSMLSVLQVSPEHCGYNPQQIKEAILRTGNAGLKQIDSDAQHLYFLMMKEGLLSKKASNASFAKENPSSMKLRFDDKRSHLNDVPGEIMKKLAPIYLEYAGEAVKSVRRKWVPIDLLPELDNADPYPFLISESKTSRDLESESVLWESYTWQEMEAKLKEVDTVILPCGSIEQHGPHLPLDVDYYDSIYLARTVAEACSPPRPLVLPSIPYGVAYHHQGFRGTISISNQTLSSLVYDIGMSLVKNGVRKIIILNAHGDNSPALNYAAQLINRDSGVFVCVETGETSDPDINRLVDTPNDIHAGEIETSTTLAIRPEAVRMENAVNEALDFGSSYLDYTSDRGVAWYVRTELISKSGVMGSPLKADAVKGKKIWEIMVAHLVRFIEEVKQSNLEDLYQRKY